MTDGIIRAFDLPDYGGSKAYARLAELAKTRSVLCVVDYRMDTFTSRDVARTQYMAKPGQEYWSVSARGMGYINAFSQAEFVSLCNHLNLEFIEPTPAAESVDAGCICKGNWRAIVAESEPLLNKRFRDGNGQEYKFFGVVHGSDGYYYGMLPVGGGALTLLSCVRGVKGHGFQLVASS